MPKIADPGKKKSEKEVFKDIIKEKFPKPKDTSYRSKVIPQCPGLWQGTSNHIAVKFPNSKDNEKILKISRNKKASDIHRIRNQNGSRPLKSTQRAIRQWSNALQILNKKNFQSCTRT